MGAFGKSGDDGSMEEETLYIPAGCPRTFQKPPRPFFSSFSFFFCPPKKEVACSTLCPLFFFFSLFLPFPLYNFALLFCSPLTASWYLPQDNQSAMSAGPHRKGYSVPGPLTTKWSGRANKRAMWGVPDFPGCHCQGPNHMTFVFGRDCLVTSLPRYIGRSMA